MDIHFEVRKKIHKTLTIFNQNNIRLLTKGKVGSFLTFKFSCEQEAFHIGRGSSLLTRKFHDEHNGT